MLDLFMLAVLMTVGLIALAKLKLAIHRRTIEKRLRKASAVSAHASAGR